MDEAPNVLVPCRPIPLQHPSASCLLMTFSGWATAGIGTVSSGRSEISTVSSPMIPPTRLMRAPRATKAFDSAPTIEQHEPRMRPSARGGYECTFQTTYASESREPGRKPVKHGVAEQRKLPHQLSRQLTKYAAVNSLALQKPEFAGHSHSI